jgi:hypothetical protein
MATLSEQTARPGSPGPYEHPHEGPSTFEEIPSGLAAAGRPITVQNALMVMVDEMNQHRGTDIKVIPRPMAQQIDAERLADIEEMLALMNNNAGPAGGAREGS